MLPSPRSCFALLLCVLCACGDGSSSEITVGFVSNGVDPFWTIAGAGAAEGAREFSVKAISRFPNEGIADQQRIVEDLIAMGVKGIAISPIDPVNQRGFLDATAQRCALITQDSDAVGSKRICYVGMDNYSAGRMCGALVREALPQGGEVMIFIGRIEQENARRRRQGAIDEILGRSHDPDRFDPPGQALTAGPFTIIDTRTDGFDKARAKANVEDALARHAELDAVVGLFAYNVPACMEALRGAGKLGVIKVIGFDEAEECLAGIAAGTVVGTVVQNPFEYGRQSVRILAGLARGDRSVLPKDNILSVPARVIRKAEVDDFRKQVRAHLEAGR